MGDNARVLGTTSERSIRAGLLALLLLVLDSTLGAAKAAEEPPVTGEPAAPPQTPPDPAEPVSGAPAAGEPEMEENAAAGSAVENGPEAEITTGDPAAAEQPPEPPHIEQPASDDVIDNPIAPAETGPVESAPERHEQLESEAAAEQGAASAADERHPQDVGPPVPGPIDLCAQPREDELTMLQRVRRSLTVTACASSAWLDGLFGDQIHYDEYHATHGSVSAGGIWSDYDGFDPRLRFRVRLQLPQWDERISAFAGRVGQEDYISDTEGDFDALPTRQFGMIEDESVLLGLGYSSPKRTGNDFDAGVGVRVDLPIDPYVRARYEIVRAFAERYVFSGRETVFWQNSEGFGTTTRVNLDRFISERFLVRWSNVGKYTEETIGLQWYTQLTLFQSLGERTGLAWQAQIEGLTDNEVPLTRHSMRLIMRRQLTPEWLILELRGGVSWPRHKLHEEREASPEVGIAFEMMFGQKDRERRPWRRPE